mmetsp:Transcript_92652/g.127699  ORF Transcript_92652/g.127699 Transcript_92652/m.127699 type:complete len:231 (+) Transcript_92652:167-859(+)
MIDTNKEAHKDTNKANTEEAKIEEVDQELKKIQSEPSDEFFNFLLVVDKELDAEDFFDHHGDELFVTLFKLLSFGTNDLFTISNDDENLFSNSYQTHEDLLNSLKNLDENVGMDSKCNYIINNLLDKQIACTNGSDPLMKLLMAITEVLYSQGSTKTTYRMAKVIAYFGKLFARMELKERSKYLMGSLFAIGGLLKVEARSYLETKNKYEKDFRIVSPLVLKDQTQENAI